MPTDIPPDLEARFLEQEHRIVRVVQNFFDRTKWPADDPRRAAARNALLWRVLAPGTAAVAAGGIVAVATLLVLVWQTSLIADQNEFFKEQNQKLQQQIDLQSEQDASRRRTEIIATLYETQMGNFGSLVPRSNPRTRAEAVLEFVQLERSRIEKLRKRVPAYQAELSLTQGRLDGLNLDNSEFQGIVLTGTFLQNTSFSGSNLARADLRAAQFDSTSFLGADLREANLEGTNLLQSSFARADLRNANLGSASVRGCEFLGADLRGALLTGLRHIGQSAGFRYANVAKAKGLTEAARSQLLAAGAVEIELDSEWAAFKSARLPSR
ncbi:pentapeptide repeat-containing protein [Ramlibacter sp. USB13]|uniref:Pentapeptide repeat-containing protein n=1 Tax=Ramlibacter cellulosilyticus TaxID=2764187 RepID=A0A923SDX1_9BURK|nr:pentapeptide repeat-containing protein [Ramlibacter cellulosilyticus]MBC5782337.1 pentapeptide repeat-containing protein [Ramlibacter cellulosilyticus]